MSKTYQITQGDTNYKVTVEISGAYEKQTRHHPGATPDVDIIEVEPDDGTLDEGEACLQVLERAEEAMEDDRAYAKLDSMRGEYPF